MVLVVGHRTNEKFPPLYKEFFNRIQENVTIHLKLAIISCLSIHEAPKIYLTNKLYCNL